MLEIPEKRLLRYLSRPPATRPRWVVVAYLGRAFRTLDTAIARGWVLEIARPRTGVAGRPGRDVMLTPQGSEALQGTAAPHADGPQP